MQTPTSENRSQTSVRKGGVSEFRNAAFVFLLSKTVTTEGPGLRFSTLQRDRSAAFKIKTVSLQ